MLSMMGSDRGEKLGEKKRKGKKKKKKVGQSLQSLMLSGFRKRRGMGKVENKVGWSMQSSMGSVRGKRRGRKGKNEWAGSMQSMMHSGRQDFLGPLLAKPNPRAGTARAVFLDSPPLPPKKRNKEKAGWCLCACADDCLLLLFIPRYPERAVRAQPPEPAGPVHPPRPLEHGQGLAARRYLHHG